MTCAFRYLKKNIHEKTKTENLLYNKLEMQEYLKTDQITHKRKILLFKLRTKMTKVGYNFGRKTRCPVCKIDTEPDEQSHLLNCLVLKLEISDILSSDNKYDDIFSNNIEKLNNVVLLFEKAIRKREELLDSWGSTAHRQTLYIVTETHLTYR